jgi:hypothetical protein
VNLNRSAGLLIAAWISAAAALADVKGVTNLPTFTPEEMALINRDSRLILATKTCAWRLRRALDTLEDIRHGASRAHVPGEPVLCSLPAEDGGRASTEGSFDLLQILKEAAGQSTNRSIELGPAR